MGESDYHFKTFELLRSQVAPAAEFPLHKLEALQRGAVPLQDIKRRTKRVWLKLLEYQWALNCVSLGNQ